MHTECSTKGVQNFRTLFYLSLQVKLLYQYTSVYKHLCHYEHFNVVLAITENFTGSVHHSVQINKISSVRKHHK
jgi:hypothetical protein